MTPEGRVKADIKKWLKSQGAYFFMPVQSGYGASTLDFLVCLNGRFYAIETKAPGRNLKASPRQMQVIEEIRAAGGWATVVDDVNDLAQLLRFEK